MGEPFLNYDGDPRRAHPQPIRAAWPSTREAITISTVGIVPHDPPLHRRGAPVPPRGLADARGAREAPAADARRAPASDGRPGGGAARDHAAAGAPGCWSSTVLRAASTTRQKTRRRSPASSIPAWSRSTSSTSTRLAPKSPARGSMARGTHGSTGGFRARRARRLRVPRRVGGGAHPLCHPLFRGPGGFGGVWTTRRRRRAPRCAVVINRVAARSGPGVDATMKPATVTLALALAAALPLRAEETAGKATATHDERQRPDAGVREHRILRLRFDLQFARLRARRGCSRRGHPGGWSRPRSTPARLRRAVGRALAQEDAGPRGPPAFLLAWAAAPPTCPARAPGAWGVRPGLPSGLRLLRPLPALHGLRRRRGTTPIRTPTSPPGPSPSAGRPCYLATAPATASTSTSAWEWAGWTTTRGPSLPRRPPPASPSPVASRTTPS